MHDIQSIRDAILPLIEAHKNTEHVEFEFRLGRHNGTYFDTNVGREAWQRVLAGLQKFNGWEAVSETRNDVYYNDEERVRITADADGNQVSVQKTKVDSLDFSTPEAPLDCRFAVAIETPRSDGPWPMDRKVSKHRFSFVRKNLSIDVTCACDQTGGDIDAEDPYTYQIELEIARPSEVSGCPEELFNVVHKVNDVLKLL